MTRPASGLDCPAPGRAPAGPSEGAQCSATQQGCNHEDQTPAHRPFLHSEACQLRVGSDSCFGHAQATGCHAVPRRPARSQGAERLRGTGSNGSEHPEDGYEAPGPVGDVCWQDGETVYDLTAKPGPGDDHAAMAELKERAAMVADRHRVPAVRAARQRRRGRFGRQQAPPKRPSSVSVGESGTPALQDRGAGRR